MIITLYCNHVSEAHIHCNKYTELRIDDPSRTVGEIIGDSHWTITENGTVLCDKHSDTNE